MIRKIKSFDNSLEISQDVLLPDKYANLFKCISADPTYKYIVRGSGLSYSPASMGGSNCKAIDISLFNRILSFDKVNGLLTCEPGVKLIDIISVIIPHGWTIAVLPGYPSISVGGCVSFNIHGKSQFHSGNFKSIVKSLKLFHPDYDEVDCSATQNKTIFDLTVGGFGQTGVITEITLKLKQHTSNAIKMQRIKTSNIEEAVNIMRVKAKDYSNIYSWHDFSNTKNFGRGVIFAETFETKKFNRKTKKNKPITSNRLNFPVNFITCHSMKIINSYYLFRETKFDNIKTIALPHGFFPIWGQEIYYRLYGKKGFLEYQFIIKTSEVKNIITELRSYIASNKQPVGLASLKIFKGETSFLNFLNEGICITLDVPNNKAGLKFFSFLDNICIKSKAIMNISKDSRLTSKTVSQVYPEYDRFKEELQKFDPKRRFYSRISKNLNL